MGIGADDLEQCNQCDELFPYWLLSGWVCPICALKFRNETHKFPEGTPFKGEIAQAMYEEAVEWQKSRKSTSS